MCGIAGIIRFDGALPRLDQLTNMMEKIRHRGPDDQGTFIENQVALGHLRLSILDLTSAGHQPMFSNDGRFVLVYNGEIYNYQELKIELSSQYQFRTNTDSEVIFAAYLLWGKECLHRFNGMWAFCLYDRVKREVFIARDRFGIKPLYYYNSDKCFVFSSEIPAVLASGEINVTINNQAVFDYLVFNRTDQTTATFYDGINRLEHGSCITVTDNGIKEEKWYNLKEHIGNPFKSAEEYRDMFQDAIKLRLRSDVPVGVCLSGGLDSSSIVSVISRQFGLSQVHTFSAVYGEGNHADESSFIKQLSPFLMNMHYIKPDALSLFSHKEIFAKAMGEPIPSTTPFAQFKVMELASKHVTVTLDGQGADEELAGYHYFFGFYYKELLNLMKIGLLLKEIWAYYDNHRSLYGLKSFIFTLLPEKFKTIGRVLEKGYVGKEFAHAYANSNRVSENIYGSKNLNESLYDHFEHKLEHLLKWEDRNSMNFSLEGRVPFLDYRLVQSSLALPSNLLIKNGMTKYILRQAMKGILPEKIRIRRDKMGYTTPEDDWLRTKIFKDYTISILNDAVLPQSGYLDINKAKKMYQAHLEKKINCSRDIWKWINLYIWLNNIANNDQKL